MNDAVLNHFRSLAEAMSTSPQDWQWIGQHMSQRMFGISEQRARDYAAHYGGTASKMEAQP